MPDQFRITWVDRGCEPQCQPDPAFPDGKRIEAPPDILACSVELPYPAKRCGYYVVECTRCSVRVAITTAGRPDDPRLAEIPCNLAAGGRAQ
jgi:hypothetical protein